MPIKIIMKVFFPVILFFLAAGLSATPLEGGYSLAPKSSASNDEKNAAYIYARQKVIEAAKNYEGTPYKYGGMTKSGMDCSGFICQSFQDALGVSLPRSSAGLYAWTVRIPLEKAQPGDFLFFRTGTGSAITHVGLYLGDKRFIHAASSGPKTGVIYSDLNERYWANAYAGAGRAFPEAPAGFSIEENTIITSNDGASDASGTSNASGANIRSKTETTSNPGSLFAGFAIAPIWNGFMKNGDFIRGISSQIYLYADTYSFGSRMVFGLEVRPEYDAIFGVFNLPVTLSLGPNDKLRVFAGPVLSVGNSAKKIKNGTRTYSKGNSWLGIFGITAAPFVIKSAAGDINPYLELAWQSYTGENNSFDLAADFSAGFRFSTGVRWLIKVK